MTTNPSYPNSTLAQLWRENQWHEYWHDAHDEAVEARVQFYIGDAAGISLVMEALYVEDGTSDADEAIFRLFSWADTHGTEHFETQRAVSVLHKMIADKARQMAERDVAAEEEKSWQESAA